MCIMETLRPFISVLIIKVSWLSGSITAVHYNVNSLFVYSKLKNKMHSICRHYAGQLNNHQDFFVCVCVCVCVCVRVFSYEILCKLTLLWRSLLLWKWLASHSYAANYIGMASYVAIATSWLWLVCIRNFIAM